MVAVARSPTKSGSLLTIPMRVAASPRGRKNMAFVAALFVISYLIQHRYFQTSGHTTTTANAAEVSIIILTYKKADALSKLLSSVGLQTIGSEIIIADNGCLNETTRVIKSFQENLPHPHITSLRLCDNPGYAAGNNAAVKLASPESKYLLFLNDDVVLMGPKFIRHMMNLVEQQKNAVAAGCKLVNPATNALIEAGSMVFKDGSAAGHGRGDPNPSEDRYSYPKPVDYVSGACLLVEKDVFMGYRHGDKDGENGSYGFDGAMFPNYYEDTDLQLHIQHDLKKEVWLQPKSVALHEEHGSFGEDESVKLMQNAQGVFHTKWKQRLEQKHIDHGGMKFRDRAILTAADLRARNPDVANILFVAASAPKRGSGPVFGYLSQLAGFGHRVTLAMSSQRSKEDMCDDGCVDEITALGVEFIKDTSLLDLLDHRVGFYDRTVFIGAQSERDLSAPASEECDLNGFVELKGGDPQKWVLTEKGGREPSYCTFKERLE